jgi:hypothetical protein
MSESTGEGHGTGLRTLLSRRVLAGVLGASPLVITLDGDARKKKRKKCKRGTSRCGKGCCIKGECIFKVKGNHWRLQADCTITRTIEALNPKAITIDGQGHTITMVGAKTGFTGAGLLLVSGSAGGRADVINLTIDGAGLTEPCAVNSTDPIDPAAITFGMTSGRIENVTIANINCTNAIAATLADAASSQTIKVANTRVSATPPAGRAGVGINISGVGRLVASVSASTFTSAALLFNTNVEATVDGCTLASTFIGGLHGASVTVLNSTITNSTVGITAEGTGTTLRATGNTIVGPDDDQGRLISGIDFRPGSSGDVNGNAISNYFVDGSGVGCGIRVATGVNPTIGTNTFPPPGNEQDVCLNA